MLMKYSGAADGDVIPCSFMENKICNSASQHDHTTCKEIILLLAELFFFSLFNILFCYVFVFVFVFVFVVLFCLLLLCLLFCSVFVFALLFFFRFRLNFCVLVTVMLSHIEMQYRTLRNGIVSFYRL